MIMMTFENGKSRELYTLLHLGEEKQTDILPAKCVVVYKQNNGGAIFVLECKKFFNEFNMVK